MLKSFAASTLVVFTLSSGVALDAAAQSAPAARASAPAATPTASQAFMALADEYFDTCYFPENPTAATAAGLHAYDAAIEDYSRAAIERQIARLQAFDARVTAVDPTPLDDITRGDRELLLGSIHSTLLTLQTIRPWQKNPDFYSSGITQSAFVIMQRTFAPPASRLRSLIARERQMPAALKAARANLQTPPKIYTEIALQQLPGLIDFFRKDVPAAFSEVKEPALRHDFAKANAAVVASLRDYERWLRREILPRSTGDFRIGEETFAKKLLFDEMVDMPLADLLQLNEANMRANQARFAAIAKTLAPDKTPQQVLAELALHHPPPAKLLDAFRQTFDGLTRFIDEKQIVTVPSKIRPRVMETPPFERATTFASMDTPGAFETQATEAYFYVTLPEASWPKKRVDGFMAQFNDPVITIVAAHEAYPGHYIQFLWMQRIHDRVRKIIGAASNVEGWAHYCEQMMIDEGLAKALFPDDPREQKLLALGQLQDALLRNARFVVGIKLHTGQFTFDQAVDFFATEGYQSRDVGLIETKRGTADPTYLYYTLGKLQILKLRADVEASQGAAFNLKSFHDNVLKQGAAPLRIVRRSLLGNDSPTL